MKILLSPAKSLDFESEIPNVPVSKPLFKEETSRIQECLKTKSVEELKSMMSLSTPLATLNFQRNQQFEANPDASKVRPALFSFDGDVYKGLNAATLSDDELARASHSLRILSGLYGILRPFDTIQPYRLEMGTKITVGASNNLYDFWRALLTDALLNELSTGELIVNLASVEYSKAVDLSVFSGRVVSPEFKDYKNGEYKIISFYAKKMRGVMARYLLGANTEDSSVFTQFESDGYRFDERLTTDPLQPVYTR